MYNGKVLRTIKLRFALLTKQKPLLPQSLKRHVVAYALWQISSHLSILVKVYPLYVRFCKHQHVYVHMVEILLTLVIYLTSAKNYSVNKRCIELAFEMI